MNLDTAIDDLEHADLPCKYVREARDTVIAAVREMREILTFYGDQPSYVGESDSLIRTNARTRALLSKYLGKMESPRQLFIKPRQFAIEANMSLTKVYQGIAAGSIPSARVAGMWRIPASFLERLSRQALDAAEQKVASGARERIRPAAGELK